MWHINQRFMPYYSVRISPSGLDVATHYRFGQAIRAAVEQLGRRVVLIASGDLSHKLDEKGPYGFAPEGPQFDEAIAQVFESGDFLALLNIPESLRERAAECGYNPFVILAGCFDGWAVESRLLSYEGPLGVGYAVASIVPGEADVGRDILAQYEKDILGAAKEAEKTEDAHRALARKSLEHTLINGGRLPLPAGLPAELTEERAGVFVTLYKQGQLRGCIGTIAPTTECVATEIIGNAISAGLNDYRFNQVTKEELPYLTYKVDVLKAPERVAGPEDLDVKRYGVIVSSGGRRGLLLPNLDGIDTVEEQVAIARQKGGIPAGAEVTLERFEVVRHE
jgi:AmmeMemoRadiSam system protein A